MNKRTSLDRRLDDASVAWFNRNPSMYGGDLHTEAQQARDEGRDLSAGLAMALKKQIAFRLYPGTGKFDSFQTMDRRWWLKTFALLDEVQQRPLLRDYPYREPETLDLILKARPAQTVRLPAWKGSRSRFEAQLHGAFLGRLVGSQFGAPIEGWFRENLRIYCEETDGYPPLDYLRVPTSGELRAIKRRKATQWFDPAQPHPYLRGRFTECGENDDIHFTIVCHRIVKQFGADFSPMDVGDFWARFFGDGCSAEGVAIRNLEAGIAPPRSGSFRNPFREWIGAQIRGDYFGYANPGDPARAADWAWRDGVVTHVRNGVYGEMWIAALIAAAYVETNPERLILAGLAQIPRQCRLAEALHRLLALHRDRLTFEQFIDDLHRRYDEHDYQGWCHVISNAEICAAALLWGAGDFDRTIAYAVLPGLDTDCNGATVGSVLGLTHGSGGIPRRWTQPFNSRFQMGFGYGFRTLESIEQTASDMAATAWRLRQ